MFKRQFAGLIVSLYSLTLLLSFQNCGKNEWQTLSSVQASYLSSNFIDGLIRRYSTVEDTPVSNSALFYSDPEKKIRYQVVTPPSLGTLSSFNELSAEFVYTPNANANGVDFFEVAGQVGGVLSAPHRVEININSVNDAPVGVPLSVTVIEDSSAITRQVTATDADSAPATLVYSLVSQQNARGNVVFQPDGQFTYVPSSNEFGEASFTFRVFDGQLYSADAEVSITISPAVDPLVAIGNNINISGGQVVVGQLVYLNPDGYAPVTFSKESDPSQGSLVINPTTGVFSYSPVANFIGPDSFTFKVMAGSARQSNVATVTLSGAINSVPVAQDIVIGPIPEDTSITGSMLATDADVGDVITYEVTGAGPLRGSLSGVNLATGSFTYRPAANYSGVDSFTYVAHDGSSTSAPKTVSISISSVNNSPVASDSFETVTGQAVGSFVFAGSDVDSATLSVQVIAGPTFGTLTLTGGLGFTYQSFAGFDGFDSIRYVVSDGNSLSAEAAVNLTVVGPSFSTLPHGLAGFSGLPSEVIHQTFVSFNGQTVMFATDAGLAISVDAGNTFVTRNAKDGLLDSSPKSFDVDGQNIFISTDTGLFISRDRGTTFTQQWAGITEGVGGSPSGLVGASSTLLAISSQSWSRLFLSTDSGNTFTNRLLSSILSNENDYVFDILVDNNSIYLGTNSGIAFSLNAGQTFNYINIAGGVNRIRKLDGLLYAMGPAGKIYKTGNNFETFETHTVSGLPAGPNGTIKDIYVSGGLNCGLAGGLIGQGDGTGAGCTILALSGLGLHLSTNNFLNFTTSSSFSKPMDELIGSSVRLYVTSVTDGVHIYTGASNAAIKAFTKKSSSGFRNNAITQINRVGQKLLIGTPMGLYSSENNGTSFLPVSELADAYINKILVDGNQVFVATQTGLYYSSDSGVTYGRRGPVEAIYDAAITGDRWILGGLGKIWTSTNAGINFSLRSADIYLASGAVSSSPIDLADSGNTVVFGYSSNGTGPQISTDGGQNFTALNNYQPYGGYFLKSIGSLIYHVGVGQLVPSVVNPTTLSLEDVSGGGLTLIIPEDLAIRGSDFVFADRAWGLIVWAQKQASYAVKKYIPSVTGSVVFVDGSRIYLGTQHGLSVIDLP